MEINEITNAIGSVGFPIVACGALFWMINTTMKELTHAITELTESLHDIVNAGKEVGSGV